MQARAFLMLMIMVPVTACTADYARLPPISSAGASGYRLGAGDEIRITVFGFDALSNSYAVSDTGTVSLPLIDSLPVEGRTLPEVQQALAEVLRVRDIAPRANVTVQVVKYRPFYILGEVQKPGEYPYSPSMTVLKAVSLAGGYTFRADTRHALITRASPRPERGRADPLSPIQPGDTIMIPETWF